MQLIEHLWDLLETMCHFPRNPPIQLLLAILHSTFPTWNSKSSSRPTRSVSRFDAVLRSPLSQTISIKIITDREGKPKGFGYVEFVELEGLKGALAKSGSVRVAVLGRRPAFVNNIISLSRIALSVLMSPNHVRLISSLYSTAPYAYAAKERDRTFGGSGGFDDDKFLGNWRRDGPLPAPELSSRGSFRGGSGFGFSRDGAGGADDEGPRRGARFNPSGDADPSRERERERPELNGDWRSSRSAMPPPPEREREPRRGFGGPSAEGAADLEETWTKGAKFRPSAAASDSGSMGRKFGSGFADRGGAGPGSGTAMPGAVDDGGDWRSKARPAAGSQRQSSYERSREWIGLCMGLSADLLVCGHEATNSTPPTPQLARKKLELLPRSGSASTVTTPLSSPSASTGSASGIKANPFGAAK